jgi:hypothetical protein
MTMSVMKRISAMRLLEKFGFGAYQKISGFLLHTYQA